MENLMTPEEVCQILGMKKKSNTIILARWVKARKIRAVRVGRAFRFRPVDVEAYIKKQVVR